MYMQKRLRTYLACFTAGFFLSLPFFSFAQTLPDIGSEIGLGSADPKTIVVNIIQLALGFATLIALIFIILGGFQWMLSAGNDEKIAAAKKTISAAIIGLIIVLISWAIVQFVIKTIIQVS